MLVEERIVEDRPRLDFKYKIQSGPTTIKSYGLALARCLRFPSSLIDKAEEIVDQVLEESLIDISKAKNTQRPNSNDSEAMEIDEANETSNVSQEMAVMDKDVIDLYSYVLLLMNSGSTLNNNVDVVNQKLVNLIDKMSPEFRELIKTSSLEEIISVLNSTRSSED
jgi:hypothetical protein